MQVVSAVDGTELIELRIEGVLHVAPEQAREFLDNLVASGVADYTVMRVGHSDQWVKLASRWGSAIREGARPFRDERKINVSVPADEREENGSSSSAS